MNDPIIIIFRNFDIFSFCIIYNILIVFLNAILFYYFFKFRRRYRITKHICVCRFAINICKDSFCIITTPHKRITFIFSDKLHSSSHKIVSNPRMFHKFKSITKFVRIKTTNNRLFYIFVILFQNTWFIVLTHNFYLFYCFYFDVAKLRIIFKCYKYF